MDKSTSMTKNDSVCYCPLCNRQLEPVNTAHGELLGYFCLNILHPKTCTYINVTKTMDYEHGQYHTPPISTSRSNN